MRTRRTIIGTVAVAVGVMALGWGHGCRVILPIFGYPPEANRESAPKDIDKTRLQAAATAPGFRLPGLTGTFEFAPQAATAEQPHVLVFYRGHW